MERHGRTPDVRLFSLGALVAVVLALAGLSPDAIGPRLPATFAAPAKETDVLLGVLDGRSSAALVRVDPVSLRARAKPRLALGGAYPWAFSPDRSALAVVRHEPDVTLRLVSVRRFARLGDIQLGDGYVQAISWPAPGRVLVAQHHCCRPALRLHLVDTKARRIVQTHEVPGSSLRLAYGPAELVLLVRAGDGIGAGRLVVFDSAGEVRSVALPGVAVGWETVGDTSGESSEPPIARRREAGLAIDPEARRAFVAEPDGRVTTIELATLAVSHHTPSRPEAVFVRLRDWLEPRAAAKVVDGPTRSATWLGGGLLAVTGEDATVTRPAPASVGMVTRAAGLDIVDTRTWVARTLDRGGGSLWLAAGGLVVTGSGWDSGTQSRVGMGIALYGPDGARRFQLFGRQAVWVEQLVGERAFVRVGDSSVLRVVNLASGRVLGERRASMPRLLLGAASPGFG